MIPKTLYLLLLKKLDLDQIAFFDHNLMEWYGRALRSSGTSSLRTTRRFPPPWSVEDIGAAFVVMDSGRAEARLRLFRERAGTALRRQVAHL